MCENPGIRPSYNFYDFPSKMTIFAVKWKFWNLTEFSLNKGCSMFDLSGPRDLECTEYELDNGGTGCKKQCEGDLCNINGMAEPVLCQASFILDDEKEALSK